MADRAARPGKHKARHRGPSRPLRTRKAPKVERTPEIQRTPTVQRTPSVQDIRNTQRIPRAQRTPSVQRTPKVQRTPSAQDIRNTQRTHKRTSGMRGPAITSMVGGVLAAAAVAGTWVVVTDDGGAEVAADDRPATTTSQSSTSMDYQRAAPEVSRDVDRPSLSSLKADAMGDYSYGGSHEAGRVTVERQELATSDSDPKDIAMAMLPQYGWDSSQFGCLDDLWYGESGWDPSAENPYSGAYGIPQALPGSKMAAAGPDWETNPATQIEWGLGYIQDRYGSPCSANSFKLANGWY